MTDWTYSAAKRLRKTRDTIERRMWLARAEVIERQLRAMRGQVWS